jgi:four helix bundle protein
MLLVEDIYAVTRGFPADERFGLTSQLRRAAVSIPSNIGEGSRRRRRSTFRYFLRVAMGSQGELDVQLEIAFRLKYCSADDYERLTNRAALVGRMLSGLVSSQKDRPEDD